MILPYVEDGTVTLIGATTENPSFEVIAPLLSRARVVRLKQLGPEALGKVLDRALSDTERGLGSRGLSIDDDGRRALLEGAGGDGRAALTALEIAADVAEGAGRTTIGAVDVAQALQDRRPYYDRQSDYHYDTISAFIKTIRGSDPDAALVLAGANDRERRRPTVHHPQAGDPGLGGCGARRSAGSRGRDGVSTGGAFRGHARGFFRYGRVRAVPCAGAEKQQRRVGLWARRSGCGEDVRTCRCRCNFATPQLASCGSSATARGTNTPMKSRDTWREACAICPKS